MDPTTSVKSKGCFGCFGISETKNQPKLNGKVSLWSLNYFSSNIAAFVYGASMTAAAVTALHYAPVLLGMAALSPVALTALTVGAAAAVVLGAILIRQRLLYDISLIFTVYKQAENYQWWDQIAEDMILGAMPLKEHAEALQTAGVTHVITLLEDFELEEGIVDPMTAEDWKKLGIQNKHISVADFNGVPPEKIKEAVDYIAQIRAEAARDGRNIKFYIHCKAGRGRSATCVIASNMQKIMPVGGYDSAKIIESYNLEKQNLAAKRKQINLNKGQEATLHKYVETNLMKK